MRIILTSILSITILFAFTASGFADISKGRNFYQFSENLWTMGQPSQSDLEQASDEGIEVVINLVPTNEGIYNPQEQKILQSQGIEYIHNPVDWSNPKPAELASFLLAMENVGDKKVLVHCWSNARASAFAYSFRMSQNSESQKKEYETLRSVWNNVAGYNLDNNKTWRDFLKANVEDKL